MESKHIIAILIIIVIILGVVLAVEFFTLNATHVEMADTANNTTMNTTVELSSDSQQSSSENSIEANRPRNNPNYKDYTPYHESEITKDGWNPKEHETYRESLGDGREKIHYDDGYFTIVDKNGYIMTYGFA